MKAIYAEYSADPERDDAIGTAIYKHEVQSLGLEDSELLFPGVHVDAHLQINDGEVAYITLRSKIFMDDGVDEDGNAVPLLNGFRFYGQKWDTGGAYLSPQMKSPEEFV